MKVAVNEKAALYMYKDDGPFKGLLKHWQLLLMLVPTLLYFLIFRYGPIFGIVISFQEFTPKVGNSFIESIMQSPWVGLDHFKAFFTSLNGMQIIRNTIVISFLKIIFGFPAPIILALLINEIRNRHFKKYFQTISYLPYFISWVILAGIIRIVFSPDTGLIVDLFKALNMETVNVLADESLFVVLLIMSDIWQAAGWGSVIYLAAISGIDDQLYEAAIIDGANKLKQLIHITLPCLAPTIVVMLILRTGTILNAGFDQIFNLYNPAVYSVGDILDTYIYRTGLESSRYSYTTAIGLFQSAIGFLMVLLTNSLAKRLGEEGIW